MSDPVAWTMVAGAGLSAAGAIAQGQAQASAARYNAAINERNAVVTDAQTSSQVARQQQEAQMTHGSLLAGYGASGVATDEGSPMDVLRMSIANAKLDEHMIRYRGSLQKMGLLESAGLDRARAETATQQSYMGAASSLLTGAGNAMYARKLSSRGSTDSTGTSKAMALKDQEHGTS